MWCRNCWEDLSHPFALGAAERGYCPNCRADVSSNEAVVSQEEYDEMLSHIDAWERAEQRELSYDDKS